MQKEAAQHSVCNQGVGKVVPSKPDNLSPRAGMDQPLETLSTALLLQELNPEALDYGFIL